MGKTVSLKKGFTINLKGKASNQLSASSPTELFAVKPPDYKNITPKLLVKVGNEVKAGDLLFYSKDNEKIGFPSPVSGEIVEIVRGDKRRIMEIKILADKEINYKKFTSKNTKDLLLESGAWSLLTQRPFSLIPDPESTPKAIFVSAFSTAPLAPDSSLLIKGNEKYLNKGLQVLAELGKVHVSFEKNQDSSWLTEGNLEKHSFAGKHPAGNVGIQIHHIDSIKIGESVWTIDLQSVKIIGQLALDGIYNAEKVIALAGTEVNNPQHYKVRVGQSLKSILGDNFNADNTRIIQGDVLTGLTSSAEDYLSYNNNQITVIPEGNTREFLGWLLPKPSKLSLSRALFSWLTPNKEYDLDTNTHGEERAFVLSGEYEKVLPMNIMPVQLLKAILAKDIEKMEKLGIYEISEEDLAICEFVCTSKIDVQQIVKEGLDLAYNEG